MIKSGWYARSPVPVQELLLSGAELGKKWLREGASFRRTLDEIERTQWLSRAETEEYQTQRLQALLAYVGQHVPHYRELFRDLGLRPDQARAGDLARLPYLTKRELAQRPTAFLSEQKCGRVFKGATSGSTGTPLTIYHDLNGIVREHAHVFRVLRWTGFREGERRAWIRGDMIVPASQQRPPFWRMNWSSNMLMMSSYHLAERHLDGYLRALARFDPILIQAYPSSIAYLANYLNAKGRPYVGTSLRAIVTSSESLLDEQQAAIERAFGCPVFDHYGSYERVAFISHCEKGRRHVHADYGYLEVAPDEDGESEIVGTGFNSRIMPLLRYRSGDGIVLDDTNRRCDCGRDWPLVARIEGRRDDYVVTKDGRHITRLGHVFTGVGGIAEGQIVQERPGEVVIVAVPLHDARVVEERLRVHAIERFGTTMDVRVEMVPHIARGANGKLRTVVRRAADEGAA